MRRCDCKVDATKRPWHVIVVAAASAAAVILVSGCGGGPRRLTPVTDRGALIVRLGPDTLFVERFELAPNRMYVESAVLAPAAMFRTLDAVLNDAAR